MQTQTALSAYQSHQLNIKMQTSSGDKITLNFNHEKGLNYNTKNDGTTKQSQLQFASMESFSFSIEGNGLDEQDKQEIEALMQIAQPFIDNFLEELQNDTPTSPVNKVARDITDTLSSLQTKDENTKNYAKNSLVELFDKSLAETKAQNEAFDQLFKEAQKLLEKTLYYFDTPNKPIYG